MNTALETRLSGTRGARIAREFFTNTAHFPIALILLELLLDGAARYLAEPDLYALLMAAGFQAYWLGSREYAGRPSPLSGNLIAPAIYTLAELLLAWGETEDLSAAIQTFFNSPHHLAYWGFSLALGSLQALRLTWPKSAGTVIVLESLVRTGILAVMYYIFEQLSEPDSVSTFFTDRSHIFITLALAFSGLMLGFARRSAEAFLALLRETNAQLRTYSEWLLGRRMLEAAVRDPASLSLQRRERSVLFMDIRGFTHWSESQAPEQVVAMLNRYFETAEACWQADAIMPHTVKVKLSGDEVMMVFATPAAALTAALNLQERSTTLLAAFDLGAGIGIHTGPLVEGLMGGSHTKNYDIIGDTVNTAKRICDHAGSGEILLSRAVYARLPAPPATGTTRQVSAKGKSVPLELLPVVRQELCQVL